MSAEAFGQRQPLTFLDPDEVTDLPPDDSSPPPAAFPPDERTRDEAVRPDRDRVRSVSSCPLFSRTIPL